MFKDYYKILGIYQSASPSEIVKAYKLQAIKYHPDKNPTINTTEMMQDINEAYLILKDKEARSLYDVEYNRYVTNKPKINNLSTNLKEDLSNDYDFHINNEILHKWIKNARRQSKNLAKQSIDDIKGITKAVSIAFINGIIRAVVLVVIINLIYLLFCIFSN
jgi:DnaJ-class molecular chaperone